MTEAYDSCHTSRNSTSPTRGAHKQPRKRERKLKQLTAHNIPFECVFVERIYASTYAIDFGM